MEGSAPRVEGSSSAGQKDVHGVYCTCYIAVFGLVEDFAYLSAVQDLRHFWITTNSLLSLTGVALVLNKMRTCRDVGWQAGGEMDKRIGKGRLLFGEEPGSVQASGSPSGEATNSKRMHL